MWKVKPIASAHALAVVLACSANDSPSADDGDTSGAGTDSDDTNGPVFFTPGERDKILSWLGPLPATPPPDPSNALADDPAAAALGQRLFFDARYSQDESVSCVTCHDPARGFAESRSPNTSLGVSFTGRASPTLLNGSYGASASGQPVWQQWDGRADSLWAQALGPPESGVVMGGSRTRVALLLYDEYRSDYEALLGPMPALRDGDGDPVAPLDARPGMPEWDDLPESVKDDINTTYVNFGKMIAAYERRLISARSKFDAFWAELREQPDSDILTDEEKAGLRVFLGAGRCVGCHGGPNFTDGQFHNIAVAQTGDNIPEEDLGRAQGIMQVLTSKWGCTSDWSDHPDKSKCAVQQLDTDGGELGAFKTPSLRSVAQRAPYMHTGTFDNLEKVIIHYDIGGAPTGFLGARDELMRPLGLTAPERQALVAFLRTLDGEPLDSSLLEKP